MRLHMRFAAAVLVAGCDCDLIHDPSAGTLQGPAGHRVGGLGGRHRDPLDGPAGDDHTDHGGSGDAHHHSDPLDGHGSDGHGGHHHKYPSEKLRTLSYVILFGVVFNMTILYAVNSRKPDIRNTCYKMLSTSMSVYCAVLINEALFGIIFDVCLAGYSHVPAYMYAVIGVSIFFMFLFFFHLCCWLARDSPGHLHAFQSLLAHLTAFAGVFTFGNLQNSEAYHELFPSNEALGYLAVIVLAWLVICGMFWVAGGVSGRLRLKYKGFDEHFGDVAKAVHEGEQEASALILGFLNLQLADYLITRKLIDSIHGSHDKRLLWEAGMLGVVGFIFCALLILATIIKFCCRRGTNQDARPDPDEKSFFNFRLTMTMSMAWVFSRASEWFFHQFDGVEEAKVWAAFFVIAVALVCTFAINFLLGFTAERRTRYECATNATLEENRQLYREVDDDEAQSKGTGEDGVDLQEQLSHDTAMENAVDHLFEGLAMLIGLSWEKSFAVAETTLVAEMDPYRVVAKCALAVILVAVVLPAWSWYMVPQAMKTWRHHYIDIERTKQREPEEAVPQRDIDIFQLHQRATCVDQSPAA